MRVGLGRARRSLAYLCVLLAAACGGPSGQQARDDATDAAAAVADPAPAADTDLLIVGAGLAGLSAAIDAAQGGARVLVIDMNSVFGGHGIQSGGVAVVGSPMQEVAGFEDTPDSAYADWMAWTEDGHPAWTRFYVENSRTLLYDWLIPLGVRFDTVRASHGNSVPRFHMTHRRGLNLVRPIYREALRWSNIAWRWNLQAEHLIREQGRVVGVSGRDLRGGGAFDLRARAVLLATGGFESNMDMVTQHWPEDLPAPARVWGMSGQNSRGDGHRMAQEVGAALSHMERQYNGYNALPNVLELDDDRGFVGGPGRSIWVNADGRRFVTEGGVDREVFPRAMRQQPRGHWSIYDDDDRLAFGVLSPHFLSASGPDTAKIQREFVDDPTITQRADSLDELARLIGVPADALLATVSEFNGRVARGDSTEVDGVEWEDAPPTFTIDSPPFYATKLYPLANKSAGGIAIDLATHALDGEGAPVLGLYAAGEVTGSAGINGLHGLDGMFTGPAILTGRVAGRAVVADLARDPAWSPATAIRAERYQDPEPTGELPAIGADALAQRLATPQDGYWHFERVHGLVLERGYVCTDCHSSALPFAPAETRASRMAQTAVCDACHLAPAGTVAEGAAERPLPARD